MNDDPSCHIDLVYLRTENYIAPVNKTELIGYLERIDAALHGPNILCVYGSTAFILLDEPDRTSLDIDIAAPYSSVDFPDLTQAASAAGLPLNPAEDFPSDHIEWISALRLCLPKPVPETESVLWQGKHLAVKTVSIPQLIASKLIRYDEIDRSDIQYLCSQVNVDFPEIATAVGTLPHPFDRDPILLDNLENLKVDMQMWKEASS